MVRITPDLLRKRAEHNEGQLSNLEEISLHQFDIDKIENLDIYCRHLKILYLQNNIIPRMENLNKLKELEYLNLALNNISKIENIERCESLKKLDLTLNFIDLEDFEESMTNLARVGSIEQLYLTGNPCSNWHKYREFVAAMVPQLRELDGKEITHSERLTALQVLDSMKEELRRDAEIHVTTKAQKSEEDDKGYTKEARVRMAREAEAQRLEKEQESSKKENEYYGIKNTEPPSVLNSKGEIRQCNQGNYPFEFSEKHEKGVQYIVLDVGVPKYMETSLIDVDLHPIYVRIDIKGKITQLRFPCEIIVEQSKVKRSQTTGALQILMPKLSNTLVPYYFTKEELSKSSKEELLPSAPAPSFIHPIHPSELLLSAPKNPEPVDLESDEDLPPLEEI